MKKFCFTILIIMLCILLCSCTPFEKHGINNYHPANSDVEITIFLPEGDFLNMFEYVEGDYRFYRYEKIAFAVEIERAFMYLKYDDEVYPLAKQYVLENNYLSENSVDEYKGYIFYDRNYGERYFKPSEFRRFAYNDSNNTLLFIGFYEGADYANVSDFPDWGAFLEEYYGEWYDFSA